MNTTDIKSCWTPVLPDVLPEMQKTWALTLTVWNWAFSPTPIMTTQTAWRLFSPAMHMPPSISEQAQPKTAMENGGFSTNILVSAGFFSTRTEPDFPYGKRPCHIQQLFPRRGRPYYRGSTGSISKREYLRNGWRLPPLSHLPRRYPRSRP